MKFLICLNPVAYRKKHTPRFCSYVYIVIIHFHAMHNSMSMHIENIFFYSRLDTFRIGCLNGRKAIPNSSYTILNIHFLRLTSMETFAILLKCITNKSIHHRNGYENRTVISPRSKIIRCFSKKWQT